jgi:CheY-like chemotaxis protein
MLVSREAIQPRSARTNDMLDVSTHKYRILVLDDKVNVSDILVQALRRKGYGADIVSNRAEGLIYLQYVKNDLILSDIRMPQINGPEFYRHIERKHPTLVKKIIFITD